MQELDTEDLLNSVNSKFMSSTTYHNYKLAVVRQTSFLYRRDYRT